MRRARREGWGARATSIAGCLALASMCAIVHAGQVAAEAGAHGDARKGKDLYEKLCTTCHGVYGRGDGPLAPSLSTPPADLTLSENFENRSDADLVKELRYGSGKDHTPMVISQALNEGALLDIVAYLRTLYVPGKHVSLRSGRDIYQSICWTCHGVNGDGNGPAAKDVQGTKPRNFTAPDFHIEGREAEVHQIIAEGADKAFHGSKYMLEWGTKLSPQQIDDVVEYLKTFKHGGAAGAADDL